jgi:small G protein signaling modulator 3
MSSSSTHQKTTVHSHPLSPDEPLSTATKGRRSRGGQGAAGTESRATSSYFTLKAQLEKDAGPDNNWDGSVRGYGKPTKKTSLPMPTWDSPTPPASNQPAKSLFTPNAGVKDIFTAPQITVSVSQATDYDTTSEFNPEEVGHGLVDQVTATKWHEYSDEALQAAMTSAFKTDIASPDGDNPYHTTIRTLSSAYHALCRARVELEETRRLIREKEDARRRRAEDLLQELGPREQDVAKRVIQSIFTDDDETEHHVERKQSVMVRLINMALVCTSSDRCFHCRAWPSLLAKL